MSLDSPEAVPFPDPDPPRTDEAVPVVHPPWIKRVLALIEVLVCSDYPTQLALISIFSALGYGSLASGQLRIGFVVTLSLADAAVLIALIFLFLRIHGERPRDVLLGWRRTPREALLGVPLIVVALVIGVGVLLIVARLAPWLHTVERNPLQDLLGSRRDAALFAIVVIIAGGLREEIQRAFLLHRFGVWLGGPRVGLVVTSIAFGAGHLLQGVDAGIATGLLGAFWGSVYLQRRSMVAPMVSHAGFDLVQIVQFMVLGR